MGFLLAFLRGMARDRPSPYAEARLQTASTGHGAQEARLQTAPTGYGAQEARFQTAPTGRGVARDRPSPYESFPRKRGYKPRLPAMGLFAGFLRIPPIRHLRHQRRISQAARDAFGTVSLIENEVEIATGPIDIVD